MGEYGLSATDVKAEYIWLSPEVGAGSAFGGDDGLGGYMPLAVAAPDSGGIIQLTWVHGNHLGVPLLTTDANGNPITGTPDYLAPGFPGQSRVIADLYYNRYRDYDPSTGRYIQADPIGLGGGSNPYGYAGGNPVNGMDPEGLQTIGAVLEVGAEFFLKRQVEHAVTRRIPGVGLALTIGDALGTAGAVGVYLCTRHNDPCAAHYLKINRLADIVRRRLIQFRQDQLNLPETNPPGVRGRTRVGEATAFYNDQASLRRAIKTALEAGCRDIPPDVWRLATMPLDTRYPRPFGIYGQ
jgi:RHS repeat-associated protein